MVVNKIKEYNCESLKQYIDIIGDYSSEEYLYRGHGNTSWNLVPYIGRIYDDFSCSPANKIPFSELEQKIFLRFRRLAPSFTVNIPSGTADLLVMAQHYGLPTRLLDWTENSLVALFFALSQAGEGDTAVYLFKPKHWLSGPISEEDIFHIDHIVAFYPEYISERVNMQKSCFTIHPLLRDPEKIIDMETAYVEGNKDIPDLARIIIKKDSGKSILLNLYELGVNHSFVFPDLQGLTAQIRYEVCNNIFKK